MHPLSTSILALSLFTASAPPLLAQANLEWTALYGASPLTVVHVASCAAVDAQGNVYVALRSESSHQIFDLVVLEYDKAGGLLWSRRFDTGASVSEYPSGIALAPNGDVCVAGTRSGNQWDLIAVRYDAHGTLLHRTIFAGAPGPGADGGIALAVDAQSNMIVAGVATDAQGNTATLVQAYSPSGALLWETRNDLSPGNYEQFQALTIDPSGDIFAAGWIGVGNDREAVIAKLSATGTLQWVRVFPGSPAIQESFLVLTSDRQGGVVAGGNQAQPWMLGEWLSNGWAARCDGNGNFLWSDIYPRGTTFNLPQSVLVDEGGVAWVLIMADMGGSIHGTLTRISASGVQLSTQSLPGFPAGMVLGNAGQVFVGAEELGGFQGNFPALTQLDSSGSINWHKTYATPGISAAPLGTALAPDSRVVLIGSSKLVSTPGCSALAMQIDTSDSPHGYCTGKVNSLGCAPRTVFTGTPRASAASGFAMQVEKVRNQKPGLFLYSITGAASTPFGGGLLCVNAPVHRTIAVHAGGGPPAIQDCTGMYSIDLNSFASGGLGGSPAPELSIAGTRVCAQAWGRDNGFLAPNDMSLSSGLTYVILP